MNERHLYQQIAEAIRKEILNGQLKPGSRLPSVRELCTEWKCTPGTIQRAYRVLAREGLIYSQAGRGTQVAGGIPQARAAGQTTLRKANLVHRSETFLLDVLTTGYTLEEVQSALELAMDRWRALDTSTQPDIHQRLRFSGSHDMALSTVVRHFFGEILPDVSLQISFNGSMGGLLALQESKADLAGMHLWDAATDTYNLPFIEKTLPAIPLCLVTFAHRRLGLIVSPGNPFRIQSLRDLLRPELRFVNRQAGSGTRVWLDSNLERLQIPVDLIDCYRNERTTHSDVARAVAESSAEVGLGLESAADAFGLDFIPLARERYDLVMRAETAALPAVQAWIGWLGSEEGRGWIRRFKGYEVQETGQVLYIH